MVREGKRHPYKRERNLSWEETMSNRRGFSKYLEKRFRCRKMSLKVRACSRSKPLLGVKGNDAILKKGKRHPTGKTQDTDRSCNRSLQASATEQEDKKEKIGWAARQDAQQINEKVLRMGAPTEEQLEEKITTKILKRENQKPERSTWPSKER